MTPPTLFGVECLTPEHPELSYSDSLTPHHPQSCSCSRSFLSASNRTTMSVQPLFSALAPVIDMLSNLDNLAKRISIFSSEIANEEYGGLGDNTSPDRRLMGIPTIEGKHGVDDAIFPSDSVSTKNATCSISHSPSPSHTRGATDEHGGVNIPGDDKRGLVLKCLQRGSSIFRDPNDPFFHDDSQGSTAAYTADNQEHRHVISNENMLLFSEGMQRSNSYASAHSYSIGSAASYGMSLGFDAQFLSDVTYDGAKEIWNASLMLGTGVQGMGDGLQLDLVSTNVKPYNIDGRVADLFRAISPSPTALSYRQSVLNFVSDLVKHALVARSFAVGGFALNAYLPDEDISLCTFLCRGQEPTWCIKVNELLYKVSSSRGCDRENKRGVSFSPIGCAKGRGCSSSNKTDHHIHQLCYVNFINSYPFQRISCAVDNKVAVKVTANCLDDFVLYIFYEDVNRLLGRVHLFKQSILLIKAWWLYENRTYNGFKMMKHVNEATLLALVFAVVNVHHERLHTPLQVFAMFFHVYGTLSWEDFVIGPAGPVPRHAYRPYTASTHPSSMLVSYDQITNYYINYLKDVIGSRQGMQKEQQFAPGSSGGMINKQSGNSRMCTTPGGQTHTLVGIMVVVHPLVPGMNMIGNWRKTPKAKRVAQIINMSARSLQRLFVSLQRETSRAQPHAEVASQYPLREHKH